MEHAYQRELAPDEQAAPALTELIHLATSGLAVVQDERVVVANAALCALAGLSPAELRATSLSELRAAARGGACAELWGFLEAQRDAPIAAAARLTLSCNDGLTRNVVIRATATRYDGRPALLIAIDESPAGRGSQVWSEEPLAQMQRAEVIGTIAGGIAHDFNNMLTIITAGLSMAAEQLPDEHPARDNLALTSHTVQTAAQLVRQLLSLARRPRPRPQLLDLNGVAGQVAALLRGALGPQIALELRLDEAPCLAYADQAQVEQVLVNLGLNARDAMPDGGRVTIQTGAAPGSGAPTVSVSDNGQGMAPAVMSRIFEPFFTTKPQGSGLGLAVCAEIVAQYGGAIEVSSAPGQGTTFTVRLPVAAAPQAR